VVQGEPALMDRDINKTDTSQSHHPTSSALPSGLLIDPHFHTLFAPDEPTSTLELQLIERVIKARLADPEREGQYSIRYAIYNMTSKLITDKLIEAERSGVDVQVLIESEQLSQDKVWNLIDERFIEAGLSVEYDHRRLSDAERQSVDLIGIEDPGLMHLKLRIFETPTWSKVLTGSLNPNTTSYLNEETLHLINDEALVSHYQTAYQHLLYDWPQVNTWHEDSPLNVLFTPSDDGPRAVTQILKWIESENEQILLMIFALRDLTAPGMRESLVELLARKVAEGVPVYVITDQKQSDGVNSDGHQVFEDDDTEDRLREVGVHVYESLNAATPYTAIHHKVAVLGLEKMRVISGASNWSKSGLGSADQLARNVESVLFIDSDQLDQNYTGRRFLGQWFQVLRRYADDSIRQDQEPKVVDVFHALSQDASWPQQSLSFKVHANVTREHEHVAIVGDLSELGVWGLTGRHQLVTSADQFPIWRSQESLKVAMGQSLTWKQVIIDHEDTIMRWEQGAHHISSVKPPLMSHRELTLYGVWR
jgi:phosphatidylserine/phosphatidylglycerophosphate/cardiolipin synthase-like enzyme